MSRRERPGERSRGARVLSASWWLRDKQGGLTVAQWPNPAIGVWAVTVLVSWSGVLGGSRGETVAAVGRGALLVWGLDELLRGDSPFRRLLGAGVVVWQVTRLVA